MTSDIKVEIFAYDIFSKMYMNIDIIRPGVSEIYGDECCKMINYVDACDKMFYDVVISKVMFFRTIHLKELPAEKIKSLKSLSDCSDFVIRACDRNDLFGHLTVFERMFSTLAFVINLSLLIYYDKTCAIDVYNYGHLFWAMYFDKLAEQFYNGGGWNELKRVASSYFELNWFVDIFIFQNDDNENDLNAMKEMFDNYQQFKSTTRFSKNRHLSKQWVNFRTKSFENYIIVPLKYQYSIDAYEADLLFEDFRRLCGSCSVNCIQMFDKCMPFDSFEEIKTEVNKGPHIVNFDSKETANFNDVYCEELSKISTGNEKLNQSKCSFENSKELPYNVIDKTTNLKSDKKSFIEKDLRKSNSVILAAHSENNHIPIETMNGQFRIVSGNMLENINFHSDHCSENILLDIKNELFPTKNNYSKSHNDITSEVVLSRSCKNSPNVPPLSSFLPKNEVENISDEEKCTGAETDDIEIITNTSSVDQIALCNRSENIPPKQVYSPQSLKPVNKCENTTDEKAKTIEGSDDLRYQNVDFVISDLLRMILVLGDRQGIEYVLTTSRNSIGIHQNLKENLIKRKKRHKKKKKTSRI